MAFLSAIFFALSNYLIGKISSQGLYIRAFIFVGNFIICVIYVFLTLLKYLKDDTFEGFLYSYSLISLNITGIHYKMLFDLCLDSLIVIWGELLVILTFSESLKAEINQGVSSSIFILSAINTALISWFLVGIRRRVLPGDSNYHNFMIREQ